MSLRKIFWHSGNHRTRKNRPIPSRPIGEDLPEAMMNDESSSSDYTVEEDEERSQVHRTRRRSSAQILDMKFLQSTSSTSTGSHTDEIVSEERAMGDVCESMSSDLSLFSLVIIIFFSNILGRRKGKKKERREEKRKSEDLGGKYCLRWRDCYCSSSSLSSSCSSSSSYSSLSFLLVMSMPTRSYIFIEDV